MDTTEIIDNNYTVTYDAGTVTCKGYLRLRGAEEYAPIMDLLIQVAKLNPQNLSAPTLLVELELRRKEYDRALHLLDRSMSQRPRKEWWQTRRGEILAMAGRTLEAVEAFKLADESIRALPANIRATAAVRRLSSKVSTEISRLEGDESRNEETQETATQTALP